MGTISFTIGACYAASSSRRFHRYSYRASKAAHNMLLRTAAIELKRLNKQSIVLCLQKPFQARVPTEKLFSAEFVVKQLIDVMAKRSQETTGSFWDCAGEPIDW